MAKNQTRRVRPSALAKDDADFAALKKIAGYAPPNPAFTIAAIQANKDASMSIKEQLAQAEALVKTLRDEDNAADWKYHNSVDGGRDSIEAQFGKDSNELQAVGRKKRSEYKNRKIKPADPA